MKTTPKDFFLHLGATIALYASAVALMNLCFSVIGYYYPDALAGYFSVSSIAWPISMLVVLVPVLYVIEYLLERDLKRAPEKKDIWIRKWRIYLTLFLSGATVAGDLIALIDTYLNGEITSRFVYKVLAVLIVSGVIFTYYLLSRISSRGSGRPMDQAHMWRKILAWLGILVVLASIIAGFAIVGSPAKQRALRFDSQRVSDLMEIQSQVMSYWQQKGTLPETLSQLNDPISDFTLPADPQTGAAYGYDRQMVTGRGDSASGASFDLCADFDLASPSLADQADPWAHPAGTACFSRMAP